MRLQDPVADRLQGPRVELRRWRTDDLDLLAEAVTANLAHLSTFMPWAADEPLERPARQALLESWSADHDQGRDAAFACFVDEVLIGSAGLHRRRPDGRAIEIGYWLTEASTGRGYATEISLLLTTEAFRHDEIRLVEIYCDPANIASAAVALRAGFSKTTPRKDGHLRFVLRRGEIDADWASRF